MAEPAPAAALVGPPVGPAFIIPCTVIQAADLADQLLDRQKNPSWHGERTKLVYGFRKATKLWAEYASIRDESLRADGDEHEAMECCRQHRGETDAKASVAWPDRYLLAHGEIPAVQHAMNLKLDRGDIGFFRGVPERADSPQRPFGRGPDHRTDSREGQRTGQRRSAAVAILRIGH